MMESFRLLFSFIIHPMSVCIFGRDGKMTEKDVLCGKGKRELKHNSSLALIGIAPDRLPVADEPVMRAILSPDPNWV